MHKAENPIASTLFKKKILFSTKLFHNNENYKLGWKKSLYQYKKPPFVSGWGLYSQSINKLGSKMDRLVHISLSMISRIVCIGISPSALIASLFGSGGIKYTVGSPLTCHIFKFKKIHQFSFLLSSKENAFLTGYFYGMFLPVRLGGKNTR